MNKIKNYSIILIIFSLFLFLSSCAFNSTTPSNPSSLNDNVYYKVMWRNNDGKLLEVDEEVLEGSIPQYDSNIPTLPCDELKSYHFSGWSPIVDKIDRDKIYTAIYDESEIKIELDENKNEYKVIGYTGNPYSFNIPSSYNDIPITSIENNAFENCKYLQNIIIPDSINNIGDNVFDGCLNLKSIYYSSNEENWNEYNKEYENINIYYYQEELSNRTNYNWKYENDYPVINDSYLKYTEKDEGLLVELNPKYKDIIDKIDVPTTNEGKTVIGIKANAFYGIDDNIEIKVPDYFEIDYNLNRYIEKLDGEYELYDTINCNGKDGDNTNYIPDEIEGFNMKEISQDTISLRKLVTINAYYDRNLYLFTLTNDSSSKGTINIENKKDDNLYKYEEEINLTSKPSSGYKFLGWYDDTNKQISTLTDYTFKMPSCDYKLIAKWTTQSYTVTLKNENNVNAGTLTGGGSHSYSSSVTIKATNNDKTKYVFDGWYKNDTRVTSSESYTFIMGSSSVTFVAKWIKLYELKLSSDEPNDKGIKHSSLAVYDKSNNELQYDSDSIFKHSEGWDGFTRIYYLKEGEEFVIKYTFASNDNREIIFNGNYSIKDGNFDSKYSSWLKSVTFDSAIKVKMTQNIDIWWSSYSCLVEGTLITMADNSIKKVEDIKAGDEVLVFNHYTGNYDKSFVIFNEESELYSYKVINLKFSDNNIVKVVSEHGFFDLDLSKYVYISEFNYNDYIGHKFYSLDGIVTLDDVIVDREVVKLYSPVTAVHLNLFANGLLSMPGGIEGMFNIFEYNDNLKYDEEKLQADINEYGLLDYSYFEDLISYEIYEIFNGKYLGIALGKGILTEEKLLYYINTYSKYF